MRAPRCINLNTLLSRNLFLFIFYSGDQPRISDATARRILEKVAASNTSELSDLSDSDDDDDDAIPHRNSAQRMTAMAMWRKVT